MSEGFYTRTVLGLPLDINGPSGLLWLSGNLETGERVCEQHDADGKVLRRWTRSDYDTPYTEQETP